MAVTDHQAPIVVCDCVAFLKTHGISDESLFRIPGRKEVVNSLKQRYDQEFATRELKLRSEVSVLNVIRPVPTVADVATLLISFLNDLSEPVFCTFSVSFLMTAVVQLIPADDLEEFIRIHRQNLSKSVCVWTLLSMYLCFLEGSNAILSLHGEDEGS